MFKKLFSVAIALGIIQILPIVDFSNVIAFVFSTLLLSILLFCIEPILRLFSLPLIIATFGFFRFVLLTGSIWLTSFLVPGFIIYPMIFFGQPIHYFFTLVFVSGLLRAIHAVVLRILKIVA